MNIDFDNNKLNLLISIFALLISTIAMYFTIIAFRLKSGQKFRCGFSTCSTIECEDKYISSITIENLKDRASVIFKIFAKYGRNNYLLIEDFSDTPLILKPFEVYHKKYDPILFYSTGTDIAKLDKIFDNQKVKCRILLTTTNGRYIVKSNTKHWDPIVPFFRNFYTAIIDPVRLKFKDKNYGSNVKYLAIFKYDNDKEQVISIKKEDYKNVLFTKFQLTKESLETKNSLLLFLKKQKTNGNISFDKIEVFDFGEDVDRIKNEYKRNLIYIEPYNFFYYNILGKILTIIDKYKMELSNRRNKKRNKKIIPAEPEK